MPVASDFACRRGDGISRQCASKWVNRYRRYGENGLFDHPSVPYHQHTTTSADTVVRIEGLRRDRKYSARRIALKLAGEGVAVSVRTVTRQLAHLGLNRRRFLDPTGENKNAGARTGYTYLHTAIDGFSRLAYTEALPNEKARTAIAFTHRARAFFTAHGITHIHRIVTDNGACYKAGHFATVLHGARHQRITPYTPRHNGKVERYHRILAEEFLYAHTWTSEQHRTEALTVWNVHYNYHRPHTTAGNQPPASRLHAGVTNVVTSHI